MELILSTKHLPRCFLLVLYCCLSFFFFCAFYQYTASRYSLARPPALSDGDPVKRRSMNQSLKIPVRELSRKLQVNSSNTIDSDYVKTGLLMDSMELVTNNPEALTGQVSSVHSTQLVPSDESKSRVTNHFGTSCTSLETKPKLILLWTPFFETWDYFPPGPFNHCPGCTNCVVTTDRKRLLQSDAVLFHARDIFLPDLPLQRLPHQRWVFYCMESPAYSDFAGFHFMYRMFNWTMTYRSDSDVVTRYGAVEKIYPKRKLDRTALRTAWEKKTKSVVWMSSHCPTDGGRDEFVYQLKKFIDVDEYGTCGTLECPTDATKKCLTDFAVNYKFFLAFENSICRDYITEKFFRTLKYDIVPVVFGGAQYEKYGPPGSFIDALQFKSPKHLAYFLTGVGKDFSLYSSYFEWRSDFALKLDNSKECALCSLLHDNSTKPSVYEDMREWWVRDGQCRTWKAGA